MTAPGTPERVRADVVIVGLGVAGACAAMEAHDHGATVAILEKQPPERHLSNTRMSGGGFHSPDPRGDRAALRAYAGALFDGIDVPSSWADSRHHFGAQLADVWAEHAVANIDFLRSLDPRFQPEWQAFVGFPDFPGAQDSGYGVGRSRYLDPDRSDGRPILFGEAFHRCLMSGLAERNIVAHYGTTARSLIQDDEDVVIGVQAEQSGRRIDVLANQAVILCCGGYEYSAPMREAFLGGTGPNGWAFYGSPANTGDGLRMALRAGAALSQAGSVAGRIITAVPQRRRGLRIGMNTSAIGKPNEIVVDNRGRRYTAERRVTKDPSRYHFFREALLFDTVTLSYPRIPSWLVFDAAFRAREPIVSLAVAAHHGIAWGRDNGEALRRGWILESDTIAGLAHRIRQHPENAGRMEVAVLCDTVARWNDACRRRRDPDFEREPETMGPVDSPPYYAVPLYPGGPNTKGGLRADASRRVLDWDDRPIPRLYAAGEIASVFRYMYQGGGNLAEGIVFGRLAGRSAAAERPYGVASDRSTKGR